MSDANKCGNYWAGKCSLSGPCHMCGFCPLHAYEANRQGDGACAFCKEENPDRGSPKANTEGLGGASSDELRTIKMQQAYRWECPDCKRENFDRAEEVIFDDIFEEEDARQKLGIPDDVEGAIVTCPDTVTCLSCFAMFNAHE